MAVAVKNGDFINGKFEPKLGGAVGRHASGRRCGEQLSRQNSPTEAKPWAALAIARPANRINCKRLGVVAVVVMRGLLSAIGAFLLSSWTQFSALHSLVDCKPCRLGPAKAARFWRAIKAVLRVAHATNLHDPANQAVIAHAATFRRFD